MLDVIITRRSVRRYSDRGIPKNVLDKIIEAGRQSPSAANKQPYHFIVVTDSEIKKELRGLVYCFLKNAPVVIVSCANPNLLVFRYLRIFSPMLLFSLVLLPHPLNM